MDPSLPVDPPPPISGPAVEVPQSKSKISRLFSKIRKHIKLLVLILVFLGLLGGGLWFAQSRLAKKSHKTLAQKFELKESSPEDQSDSFAVVGQPTFVFSKPIGVTEANLGNYFHLTPEVSGSWHLEKNGQVVYFSSNKTKSDGLPANFSYNSVYTITIDKSFYSTDKQKLPEDITVAFRTKQNPDFTLQTNKKLIATDSAKPVEVSFNSYSSGGENSMNSYIGTSVNVSIGQANEKQLIEYFSYKGGKNSLYYFEDAASLAMKQMQRVIKQSSGANSYNLSLPADNFPKPGIYYVKLENDSWSEDLFVVASGHINQVFNDANNTYVWASEQNTGKSISGVEAELYKVKGPPVLVDKVTTGADGIAKSAHGEDAVDFVITHSNGDIAVTFTKVYYYAQYGRANYQVFSYSDRPVYRAGDKVHYKAVLRKRENGDFSVAKGAFFAKLQLDYNLQDQDNYTALEADENGTVYADIDLPSMVEGNYPQIILSVKNDKGDYQQIDSLPLSVQAYRKPDMDISATALEKEYVSGDDSHVNVTAKTNFGQPLSNIEFTYRVLLTDFTEIKDRTAEDVGGVVSGYYGAGQELITGNGKFDEKGTAQITFSTKLADKFELSQIATLEVTPNIGATPSFGKIAKLIHRGEFALFVDNLSGDTEKGISGNIAVLDHNTPRKVVAAKPLVISLYKVVSYSDKQLIASQNAVSGADGTASFAFANLGKGSYEVAAQAGDSRGNTVTGRAQVYVGEVQQYTYNKPQDAITLTSSKNLYKVGETANIGVSATFGVNDAIVVITQNSGTSSNIVSLSKNNLGSGSWNLPIEIVESFGRGIGVDVFTVNAGQVISNHINLLVDKGSRKLTTKIAFDKQIYKPGDSVSAAITTQDEAGNPVSADNSLSVIDASILQIGQFNENIYDNFYNYTPTSAVSSFSSTTGVEAFMGGGGGGCFLAGTKILMEDGTARNIEDIRIGDKIKTRSSERLSSLVPDTVSKTFRHAVSDYLTINGTLNVTWVHRIFLNNAWHEAGEAEIGDTLLDENGNSVKIISIEKHVGQFVVYNLTTFEYHTFFANGFYVHNEKGMGPRENFADTAYWNPHLQTDASGRATVTFKLPDNLTTFTAQVFSNTKNSQFGQTTGEFISQKGINIIPVVSNFYYQADQPVVSALVQNSTQQDVEADVSLTIKEIGFSKSQPLKVASSGFGEVKFPLDAGRQSKDLSFTFEAKDKQGNTLDSVSSKRPILPQGNINSFWQSFEGSKKISYEASYPDLDFNKMDMWVAPNVVSALFHNNYPTFGYDSSEVGRNLYVYSNAMAMTRDGLVSPTSYQYAKLRNSFLETVSHLLEIRSGDHWNVNANYSQESQQVVNLWLAAGLDQAAGLHMIDEVSNMPSVVEATKQYVKSLNGKANKPISNLNIANLPQGLAQNFEVQVGSGTPEEKIARQWVLGDEVSDPIYKNTPESVAIRAMNGDKAALSTLRNLALNSADDRYVWDGDTQFASVLPALAMIEKGTNEDANRAIKGLSFSQAGYSQSLFSLLAGLMYAQRNNLYIEEPKISVAVNGKTVYEAKQDKEYNQFGKTILAKNYKDGKVSVEVKTSGDIPVYTTILETNYDQKQVPPDSGNKAFSFNSVKKSLSLKNESIASEAKVIDINLKRSFKDLSTGDTVSSVEMGKSGAVVISGNNIFSKYQTPTGKNHNNYVYSYLMEDAISPSFIYLNQENSYSSSSQYQSAISKIFPGDNAYSGSAVLPSDYSDEAVFFGGVVPAVSLVFPYVVYNVSGGTYYQPKTSIVFPVLGLVAPEE